MSASVMYCAGRRAVVVSLPRLYLEGTKWRRREGTVFPGGRLLRPRSRSRVAGTSIEAYGKNMRNTHNGAAIAARADVQRFV